MRLERNLVDEIWGIYGIVKHCTDQMMCREWLYCMESIQILSCWPKDVAELSRDYFPQLAGTEEEICLKAGISKMS